MFCPKCGKELREGAAFCNGCGCSLNEQKIGNESQAKIKRWPMFLVLSGIGIIGMFLIRFALMIISAKLFGEYTERALEATCGIFIVVSIILLAVEAVFVFFVKPIKKTLTSVLPIVLEAAFILFLVALAPIVAKLLSTNEEIFPLMIDYIRKTALFTIIPLAISGVLTFFIGKRSSAWGVLISVASVVFSFAIAFLTLRSIYVGKSTFGVLGYAMSFIQPFAVLMPLTVKNRNTELKKHNESTQTTNQVNPVSNSKIMFCPNCGMRFPNGKKFCDQCGSELKETTATENISYSQANPQDAKSTGFGVLGFFFPAIGLILYLVWKDSMPLRAKSTGKGALAGAITGVALTILIYVVYFIIIASLF